MPHTPKRRRAERRPDDFIHSIRPPRRVHDAALERVILARLQGYPLHPVWQDRLRQVEEDATRPNIHAPQLLRVLVRLQRVYEEAIRVRKLKEPPSKELRLRRTRQGRRSYQDAIDTWQDIRREIERVKRRRYDRECEARLMRGLPLDPRHTFDKPRSGRHLRAWERKQAEVIANLQREQHIQHRLNRTQEERRNDTPPTHDREGSGRGPAQP